MDIKELFVINEIAIQLKEKEFNEPCFSYIDTRGEQQFGIFDFTNINGYKESNAFLAPLYQQVINWLESKHNLRIVRVPEAYDWWELWEILGMGYHKRLESSSLNTIIEETLKLI